MNLPPTDLPEPLAIEARRAWLAVLEAAGESLAQELAAALAGSSEEVQLPRVLACSPFVADTLRRQPQLLLELIKSGDLQKAQPVDHFHATLQRLVNAGGADIASVLRRYRTRHMVRIVWRDFIRLADTLETVRDTSSLAEAAIAAALQCAHAEYATRFGEPRGRHSGEAQQLIVLAMGKLGARELNVSSDIDLIFVYPEGGSDR